MGPSSYLLSLHCVAMADRAHAHKYERKEGKRAGSPVFGLRYPEHPRLFWKTKTEDGGSLVFSDVSGNAYTCARESAGERINKK